jgi:hypothetical protein
MPLPPNHTDSSPSTQTMVFALRSELQYQIREFSTHNLGANLKSEFQTFELNWAAVLHDKPRTAVQKNIFLFKFKIRGSSLPSCFSCAFCAGTMQFGRLIEHLYCTPTAWTAVQGPKNSPARLVADSFF